MAEQRWSWRWLFDGFLYWGRAGVVTAAMISVLLVLMGAGVAVTAAMVPSEPFDPIALFPLGMALWMLQFVPMLGPGYLHTISRGGRPPERVPFLRPTRVAHPPVFHPPLRPAWWYRTLGWSLAAMIPPLVVLPGAYLLLATDDGGYVPLMLLAWGMAAGLLANASIAFRVARWVEGGALLPPPPQPVSRV
jgi:hypothetical protein